MICRLKEKTTHLKQPQDILSERLCTVPVLKLRLDEADSNFSLCPDRELRPDRLPIALYTEARYEFPTHSRLKYYVATGGVIV